MTTVIHAERRAPLNSSGLRNLRREGRLPGIVFGKKSDNLMIHISTTDFQRWMKQDGAGFISLRLDENTTVPVLLEALQRDPVTREWIHVDFQRVRSDIPVRTNIPVRFLGEPVGTKQGGIVQVQRANIEVEALTDALPQVFELDIGEMNISDAKLIKDVPMPEGVELVSDPEECLVVVAK